MRSLRWMLGLGLVLAACRSESLTPVVETDVGTEDSGTPTDAPFVAMDASTRLDACVPSGVENTATTCGDNIDNDCNGFTDCRDFSCSRNNPAVTFCPDAGTTFRDGSTPRDIGPCTMMGPENTAAACTDGLDNDCDGFRDCSDFDCPRTTCPRDGGTSTDRPACDSGGALENTAAACTDGIDNDCDGFLDCADFDCPRTTCPRDGGTAATDRPACDSGGALENTVAACTDGIDNDCDGFLDCMDDNCSCIGSCPPGRRAPVGCMCRGTEDNTAACGDGVDNDCNGFRDCADFSCSRSTTVTVCRDATVPRD